MASPHLKGFVLTISTHNGPLYVYHYEPTRSAGPREDIEEDTVELDDDDDSSPSYASDDGQPPLPVTQQNSGGSSLPSHEDSNTAFGFDPQFLAEILCPPRDMCNQRFDMFIDDVIFVGIPIHILSGGTWRELRKSQTTNSDDDEPDEPKTVTEEDSPLRMFHLVMVLKPPIPEAMQSTDMLYQFIVAPFARILRHEQAARNYVWKQSQQILKAREEGSPMAAIELVRALNDMYSAIAHMGIARIQLGSRTRAFQIPVQPQLRTLKPLPRLDYAPGAYLSTSYLATKEIGQECYDCYSLLLLDNPETIVQEIGVECGGPVAVMIWSIQPTMSIAALAKQHEIDLRQMVQLVYSLVYWRRARIIIPLHHRHIYGVSPLAPVKRLPELSRQYSSLFPMTPPLPRILASLSTGRPQPYFLHIPTRDHRDIYMRILAWLLQHNFVVHLQTFALIIATRKVKLAVLHQLIDERPDDVAQQDAAAAAQSKTDAGIGPSGEKSTKGNANKQKRSSSSHDGTSVLVTEDLQDSLIAAPVLASLNEKRWLNQIVAGHSDESAAMFHRLSKYFNGKDCLEQVAMREGLGRNELRRFLHEFSSNIVTYRHW